MADGTGVRRLFLVGASGVLTAALDGRFVAPAVSISHAF